MSVELKRICPVTGVGRSNVVPTGICNELVVPIIISVPSNVNAALSSIAPDVPARTILFAVRSDIVALLKVVSCASNTCNVVSPVTSNVSDTVTAPVIFVSDNNSTVPVPAAIISTGEFVEVVAILFPVINISSPTNLSAYTSPAVMFTSFPAASTTLNPPLSSLS